jgi:hypothetical protein
MDKNVLAAAFWRNEAKALGRIEELYSTDGHLFSFNASSFIRATCADEGGKTITSVSEGFGWFGSQRSGRINSKLRLTRRKYHHGM